MKKSAFYSLLLINCIPCFSQEIINMPGLESNVLIEQIQTFGIDDLLNLKGFYQNFGNYSLTMQIGNENKTNVNQYHYMDFETGNQSFALQTGASNELHISQTGSNNGVLTVQEGSYNIISAGQDGNGNVLLAWQKGNNNLVTGYLQGNESEQILYEKIIQTGDNLSLIANDVSKSKTVGNIFTQTGSNLSIEVNNGLLNTIGGIEINQTGTDMKVVVDQSYFSFPLK